MEEKEAGKQEKAAKVPSNAWVYLGVAVLKLSMAALTAFVIVDNADVEAHEIKAVSGQTVTLTKAEASGREIFGEQCAQCHTLAAANAVGDVGPNLDDLRPDRELVLNAIEHGRTSARGTMPGNLVQGEEMEEVADFVVVATN